MASQITSLGASVSRSDRMPSCRRVANGPMGCSIGGVAGSAWYSEAPPPEQQPVTGQV